MLPSQFKHQVKIVQEELNKLEGNPVEALQKDLDTFLKAQKEKAQSHEKEEKQR